MLRSSSSWQDASGLEQRGGNERPLVAGMDAQRNLAWMPGLSLSFRHVAFVRSASIGIQSTIRVSGFFVLSSRALACDGQSNR